MLDDNRCVITKLSAGVPAPINTSTSPLLTEMVEDETRSTSMNATYVTETPQPEAEEEITIPPFNVSIPINGAQPSDSILDLSFNVSLPFKTPITQAKFTAE